MVIDLMRAGEKAKNNLDVKLERKNKEKYTLVSEMLGDLNTLSGPSYTGIVAIVHATPQSSKFNKSGDSHPSKDIYTS